MKPTHIVGVDPGLVHTGVVRMLFVPSDKTIWIDHEAVPGPDADAVHTWVHMPSVDRPEEPHIYVEGYKPRSNFGSDPKMIEAVSKMRNRLGATVLLNTGVKKVVKQPLMELLGVWKFSTRTNHQDLRSAARIALLGMLKQEPTNRLLADVVRDHLSGDTWRAVHR